MLDLRPIYVLSLFRAEIIINYMKLFDTIVISFSYLCTHQSNLEHEIIPGSMKIIELPNPNEADFTPDSLKADNHHYIEAFARNGEQVTLIDTDYEETMKTLLDT